MIGSLSFQRALRFDTLDTIIITRYYHHCREKWGLFKRKNHGCRKKNYGYSMKMKNIIEHFKPPVLTVLKI